VSPQDFSAFAVSLKLGLWVTAILLTLMLPLAWVFSRARGQGQYGGLWVVFAESLITLPMVLPPTVLGFFLLLALSPRGGLAGSGAWMDSHLGLRWVFSFPGLVLASCLSGLPFMYTALRNGIQAIPTHLFEASYLLGRGPWKTLFTVALPNMKAAVATALVLTFAHAPWLEHHQRCDGIPGCD
jgi:molybdate transport system permease protein